MKKFNSFNESKKSKKYCICKKTYTKWNSEENNIFNGLDPKMTKYLLKVKNIFVLKDQKQ